MPLTLGCKTQLDAIIYSLNNKFKIDHSKCKDIAIEINNTFTIDFGTSKTKKYFYPSRVLSHFKNRSIQRHELVNIIHKHCKTWNEDVMISLYGKNYNNNNNKKKLKKETKFGNNNNSNDIIKKSIKNIKEKEFVKDQNNKCNDNIFFENENKENKKQHQCTEEKEKEFENVENENDGNEWYEQLDFDTFCKKLHIASNERIEYQIIHRFNLFSMAPKDEWILFWSSTSDIIKYCEVYKKRIGDDAFKIFVKSQQERYHKLDKLFNIISSKFL